MKAYPNSKRDNNARDFTIHIQFVLDLGRDGHYDRRNRPSSPFPCRVNKVMSKVFVASLPTRWDAATKKQVPSLDLNPAMEFGELVILTEGRKEADDFPKAIDLICKAAGQFTNEDYILFVGDPILNSVLVSEINDNAHYTDHEPFCDIKCLRWVRKDRCYEVLKI